MVVEDSYVNIYCIYVSESKVKQTYTVNEHIKQLLEQFTNMILDLTVRFWHLKAKLPAITRSRIYVDVCKFGANDSMNLV